MNSSTQSSVVRVSLDNSTISFARFEDIRNLALQAQANSDIRALAIDLDVEPYDPSTMGPWPERLASRAVAGSHGPGPIVEQDLIRALRDVLKPTVAIIHSSLSDFAIDLASICDLRLAVEGAQMIDTRVVSGRAAASGNAYMLPRLVGLSQAMRISLLGEELTAKEALRIGYIHRVIPKLGAVEAIDSYIEGLAKMPTRAWEVHKMQVLGQLDQDFDTAMVHSLGIRQTHVIKDRMEGIKAWRERRDPEFTGK